MKKSKYSKQEYVDISRVNKKAKKVVSDMKLYTSPEEINFNGALNLIADIFFDCAFTYTKSYKIYLKYKKFYEENVDLVLEWRKYNVEKRYVARTLSVKETSPFPLTEEQRERIESFYKKPQPRPLVKGARSRIEKYEDAVYEMTCIELFLNSERAQIFSMGKLAPDEFIERCKRRAKK